VHYNAYALGFKIKKKTFGLAESLLWWSWRVMLPRPRNDSVIVLQV